MRYTLFLMWEIVFRAIHVQLFVVSLIVPQFFLRCVPVNWPQKLPLIKTK